MIGALLRKERDQHLGFIAAAQVLLGLAWLCAVAMGISGEQDSLFRTCGSLTYVAAPMLAWMLVLRLVVREYTEGNDLFLSALPVPLAVRSAVKIGFGLAVMLGSFAWLVVVAGLLTQWREVVGLRWMLQALWQVEVYAVAWFGICWGVAHLGRFRNAVAYPGLFCLLVLYDEAPDAMRAVDWLGTLIEPLDTTVHAPPWAEVPPALAWGALGLALGCWLAARDGGTRVRLSFRPLSTVERSGVLGGGLAAILACAVTPDLLRADPPAPAPVRAVGGDLDGLVAEVARLRTEASALLGVSLPAVVLLPGEPGDVAPVLQEALSDTTVVSVRVPAASRQVQLAGVLSAVLVAHVDGTVEEGTQWAAHGLGPWLVAGQGEHVFARRAALASEELKGASLSHWRALEVALGGEVRAGLAWAGWAVLTAAEREVVARALVGQPARSTVGMLLWGPRRAGPAADTHSERIGALLGDLPVPAVPMPAPPVMVGEMLVPSGEQGDELWLRAVHPLHTLEPAVEARPWRLAVEELPLDGVPVAALDQRIWQATVAREVESLSGHVISGWQEVTR